MTNQIKADNVMMKKSINKVSLAQRWLSYKKNPLSLFLFLLVGLATIITVGTLVFIIAYIMIKGIPHLTPTLFAWSYNSDNVSMVPALINTLYMTAFSLLLAVPMGIGGAIYLVEYARKSSSKFVSVVRITAETLTGIPSIVYGLFGFLFFVAVLEWGMSLIAGAFTLAIMILPIVLRATEEALKSVPDTYREGSFGLGAGRLRTVLRIVLPSAIPGILAGIILSIGRIVGESAALLYTAGTMAVIPENVFGSARTMSVHMYVLSNEGLYINETYATAVVLVVLVILINAVSSRLAKRLGKGNDNGKNA